VEIKCMQGKADMEYVAILAFEECAALILGQYAK
jgi:hypothetical protein